MEIPASFLQRVQDWQTTRKLISMNMGQIQQFQAAIDGGNNDPFVAELLIETKRRLVMFGEYAANQRFLVADAAESMLKLLGRNAPRSLAEFAVHLQPHGNVERALALWPTVQVDMLILQSPNEEDPQLDKSQQMEDKAGVKRKSGSCRAVSFQGVAQGATSMDWTQYAFDLLRQLRVIAFATQMRLDQVQTAAKLIREAAAEATELARRNGMLEGQDTPEQPPLEIVFAWSKAVPGLVRCGKACSPSAHEFLFDHGQNAISLVNLQLPQVDDAKLVTAATEVLDSILGAAGRDELSVLDAGVMLEARAVAGMSNIQSGPSQEAKMEAVSTGSLSVETTENPKLTWQEAAKKLRRLKDSGEQFASRHAYAERFGCSRLCRKTLRTDQA